MRIRGSKTCPKCDTRTSWVRLYLKPWITARWPCPTCDTVLRFDPRRRSIITLIVVILIALLFLLEDWFFPLYVLGVVISCTLIEGIIEANDRETAGCTIAGERAESIHSQIESWKCELAAISAEKETLMPQRKQRRLILVFASAGAATIAGTVMAFCYRDAALFAGLLGIALAQVVTRVCFLFSATHQEYRSRIRVLENKSEGIWDKINRR